MKEEIIAKRLTELGNITRLKIFRYLVKAGHKGASVGDIQTELAVPNSTLSHHISKLRHVGLVKQHRDGRTLYCQPQYEILDELIAFLREECCINEKGQKQKEKKMKKILFVCVENSCRSQMAEAFGHIHGKTIVESYSSGSKPSGIVNPKAIKAMAALNYDLTNHQSKSLDEIPQVMYDYAITMGCGDECPNVKAKHRMDWEIPDPKHLDEKGFNQVRDFIEEKVLTLLKELG